MSIKDIAMEWLRCYNQGDAKALSGFYHENAVNDRVADVALKGRDAIEQRYTDEFAVLRMQVSPEKVYEADPWIIVEWKDQLGFRGCLFFQFEDEKIIHQRSYWDTLTYQQKYNTTASIH